MKHGSIARPERQRLAAAILGGRHEALIASGYCIRRVRWWFSARRGFTVSITYRRPVQAGWPALVIQVIRGLTDAR